MTTLSEMNIDLDMIGAPLMIFEVKSGPRFFWLKMNKAAEQFYGISKNNYLSREMSIVENQNDNRLIHRKLAIAGLERSFVSRDSVVSELQYQRRDGVIRKARHTIVPLMDASEVKQILVTSIDITELADTQMRLEEALTKTLSKFVTICANCKKIHNDDEWQPIDQYASEQLNYHDFSHGLCEICVKLYEKD